MKEVAVCHFQRFFFLGLCPGSLSRCVSEMFAGCKGGTVVLPQVQD